MKLFRRVLMMAVILYVLSGTALGVVSDGGFAHLPGAADLLSAESEQGDTGAQPPAYGALSTPAPTPAPPPTPPPAHTPQPEQTPDQAPDPTPDQTPDPAPEQTPAPTPPPEPTPFDMPAIPDAAVNPWRTNFPSPVSGDQLSDYQQSWSFRRNTVFQPPEGFMRYDIRPFGGDYLGDISRRVVYLTFDNGYEMGFTPIILDTLKDRGISATFFVTRQFLRSSPELVLRMIDEGHIVGNHSAAHLNMSQMTDAEIIADLREVEDMFFDITGRRIDPFFRFPNGDYSIRALNTVYEMGYWTFFWSLAYMDWDTNNQPGRDVAFRQVTNHIHNGCVILLHAVSESNTEALGDIIDRVHAMGFTFETLADLRPHPPGR